MHLGWVIGVFDVWNRRATGQDDQNAKYGTNTHVKARPLQQQVEGNHARPVTAS
jgi:hypothetical protein